MKTREGKIVLKQVVLSVVAIIAYYGLVYLLIVGMKFTSREYTVVTDIVLVLLDGALAVLFFKLARKFAAIWRYIFVFFALANLMIALSTLFFMLSYSVDGFGRSDVNQFGVSFFYYGVTFFKLLGWICIAIVLLIYSRKKLRFYLPFVPTLVSILFSIGFIILSSYFRVRSEHFTWLMVLRGCGELVYFMVVIFCLPLIENLYLTLLAYGFLLLVVADMLVTGVLSSAVQFKVGFLSSIYPSHTIWLLGKLFVLFAVIDLYREKNENPYGWFFSVDNIRPQIIYWGNSVAMLFLLMLGVPSLIIKEWSRFTQLTFDINITILVPFVGIISLLTKWFNRRFVGDYSIIKEQIYRSENMSSGLRFRKRVLYFSGLRQVSNFLVSYINLLLDKKEAQKKVFQVAMRAAHDIRTPISVLSLLSDAANSGLDKAQQDKHGESLRQVKAVAENILALQQKSSLDDPVANKAVVQSEFVAILLNDLYQKNKSEYADMYIEIDRSAWFALVNIISDIFNDTLTRLFLLSQQFSDRSNQGVICFKATVDGAKFNILVEFLDEKVVQLNAHKECKAGFERLKSFIKSCGDGFDLHLQANHHLSFLITFPMVSPLPSWWVDHINLAKDTCIVIFDDEAYYHAQWSRVLKPIVEKFSRCQLVHCYTENDFVKIVNRGIKNRFFIMDYDIKGSHINGIEYIKQYNLSSCAILVTNYFANQEVREQCSSVGIRMLPKPLIDYVKIDI